MSADRDPHDILLDVLIHVEKGLPPSLVEEIADRLRRAGRIAPCSD